MTKSATIYRDIALLALKADEGRWSEAGTLETVLQYAWNQLLYRHSTNELAALISELSEAISDEEAP